MDLQAEHDALVKQQSVIISKNNSSRIDSSSLVDLSASAGPAVISGSNSTKNNLTRINLLFVCVDIRSALHRLVGMLTISKFSTMLCSGWTRVIRCHFCSSATRDSGARCPYVLVTPPHVAVVVFWYVGRMRCGKREACCCSSAASRSRWFDRRRAYAITGASRRIAGSQGT